jgi:hypothetical protein
MDLMLHALLSEAGTAQPTITIRARREFGIEESQKYNGPARGMPFQVENVPAGTDMESGA